MVTIKMNPDPEEYKDAENRFMRSIGVCVTQWAFIDRCLFYLLKSALGTSAQHTAIVHYNQQSISARLALVNKLLTLNMTDNIQLNQWNILKKTAEKLIHTRNVIAHHPIKRTGTAHNDQPAYIYSIYVEPNQRLVKDRFVGFGEGKYELTIDDLEKHEKDVEDLYLKLVELSKALDQQDDTPI